MENVPTPIASSSGLFFPVLLFMLGLVQMTPPPISAFMFGMMRGDYLSWSQDDMVAPMLILVLGMAMGICLVCLLLVVHHVRSKPDLQLKSPRKRNRHSSWSSSSCGIFAPPSRWVAVRSTNLYLVQKELGIHDPVPCTWEEGLGSVKDQKLFLSPPLNGWILVMGASLPDPSADIDQCFRFIQALSRIFGRVQFFQAERVVNHHAWAIADRGQILRAYAWADGTHWNQGVMTKDEIELKLRCFDYLEQPDPAYYGQVPSVAINTDRVVLLAARWSIDPSSVNARMLRETLGITGRPTRSIAY